MEAEIQDKDELFEIYRAKLQRNLVSLEKKERKFKISKACKKVIK